MGFSWVNGFEIQREMGMVNSEMMMLAKQSFFGFLVIVRLRDEDDEVEEHKEMEMESDFHCERGGRV